MRSQKNVNSTFSHPTASCPIASALYFKWTNLTKQFKKGSEQYETACLKYKWHLAKCAVCREGLDAA